MFWRALADKGDSLCGAAEAMIASVIAWEVCTASVEGSHAERSQSGFAYDIVHSAYAHSHVVATRPPLRRKARTSRI